jgi:type IV secretion system protein VirB9
MSPARRLARALALIFPILHTATHADTLPPVGLTDARIRTVTYRREDVIRLVGQVGYQIDLEFAPEEHFVGLASGDMEGITFETNANHLFLKPKATQISTNLTILTDRRAYHLDYRTAPKRTDPRLDPVIYAVRFRYPEEEARAAATAAEAKANADRLNAAFDASFPAPGTTLNLDYAYCGPKPLRPDAAADDGIQTRLAFGTRSELPAIFVRNDDGSESLVNFTVTGDALLIHRIARQFILRRGHLVACVVNRHFDGAAQRLSTGTVAPTVTRDAATAP